LLQGAYKYHKEINDDCVLALATGKQGETPEQSDGAAQDVGRRAGHVRHAVQRDAPPAGLPDDVAKYTQDAPYQQALDKHLK
jgi:hypothetical protein